MGALYMGNKPVLKVDSKVAVVMEQFLRLLHAVGLPPTDVDFINSDGPTMHKLLLRARPRNTLFTGSSRVAERLARDLRGKLKVEDAGFDWKVRVRVQRRCCNRRPSVSGGSACSLLGRG
jgi:1-pyrroline-5-carboxylate dehydrogenase